MALDRAQRGVLRGMLGAVAVTLAVFGGALWAGALGAGALWGVPEALEPGAAAGERIAAALRWDVGVLACLIASVGRLAQHRFFTPADIDGSGLTAGTERARVLQAVLQNTLEQAAIAVLAHLLWAASLPAGWFAAVPAAVLLFVAGRLAFAAGYAGGAPTRAFGFALTFYPSVLLSVAALCALLWRGLGG